MNAFMDACLIEQRGMSALLPYLESRAHRGQVIQVSKGRPSGRSFAFADTGAARLPCYPPCYPWCFSACG
jgi:hypothetical protein